MKQHTHILLPAGLALLAGLLAGCASTGGSSEGPSFTRADIITAAEITAGIVIDEKSNVDEALEVVADARALIGEGKQVTVEGLADYIVTRAVQSQGYSPGQVSAMKSFVRRYTSNMTLELDRIGIDPQALVTVHEVLDAIERVALEVQRFGTPKPRTYADGTPADRPATLGDDESTFLAKFFAFLTLHWILSWGGDEDEDTTAAATAAPYRLAAAPAPHDDTDWLGFPKSDTRSTWKKFVDYQFPPGPDQSLYGSGRRAPARANPRAHAQAPRPHARHRSRHRRSRPPNLPLPRPMIAPSDRVLDCRIVHDPRSAAYRMGSAAPGGPQRSRRWPCAYRLDQGREGACVGFSGAHRIGAAPMEQRVNAALARSYYKGAQLHDQWPGEQYEGSSVLGLMRYWKKQGLIAEYRWCFTFREITQALSAHGPLCIGAPWPRACNFPSGDGGIEYRGTADGGHAVIFDQIDFERQRIWLLNSWGRDWGRDGRAWLTFADVRKMIEARASFALPSELPIPQQDPQPKRWWQFWK